MALSGTQQAFIQQYITDNNLGRVRSKIAKSQYKDFVRRLAKTEEALSVLPTDHPGYTMLKPQLDAAQNNADQGNFKQAYKDLEDVKNAAKRTANGYVVSITGPMLRRDVDDLNTDVTATKTAIDQALDRCDAFETSLGNYPKASDKADISEAALFLKGFANYEAVFAADFNGRIDVLKQRGNEAQTRDIPAQITAIRRKIALAEKDGRMGEISEEVARLNGLDTLSKSSGGVYVDDSAIAARAAAYTSTYEGQIKAIKSMDSFKTTDDWASMKLDEIVAMYNRDPKEFELDIRDTAGTTTLEHAMEDDDQGLKQHVFMRLMREEEERLARAAERYKAAAERDKALTDGDHKDPKYDPSIPVELETFDASTAIGAALDPLPASIDNFEIMKRQTACKDAITNFLANTDPNDEAFLDLMLQDKKEMFATLARETGVPEAPEDCTEDHRDLLNAMADTITATVLEKSPNKMAPDHSAIDVGGVHYVLDKVLGGGANGTARRYSDPVSGKSIVVKSLNNNDADARGPMVNEMRTHARLLKGDTVESKDAVAEMKGAAVGADGTLHMVMADAGGADLQKTTKAMLMMSEAGIIPPEARQAMAQNMARQTIEGLLLMEEKNLIHNDLKPENILMGADGKVRIIDFGESRFADDEGMEPSSKVAGYGVSRTYEAPEHYDTPQPEVDKGVDTYALGAIMMAMGGGYGENAPGQDFVNKFSAQDEAFSALDRVTSSAMAKDSADRPSLEAIAASTYLQLGEASERDYVPSDVADLTAAAAEFQKHLAGVTAPIAHNEYPGATPGTPNMVELQGTLSIAEMDLINLRNGVLLKEKSGGTPTKRDLEKIAEKEEAVKALNKKRNDAMEAVRAQGADDYQALLADDVRKIDFGDGEVSIKAALVARDEALKASGKLRGEFYRLEHTFKQDRDAIETRVNEAKDEDLDAIQTEAIKTQQTYLDKVKEINVQLVALAEKAATIMSTVDAAIKDDLSDAAKFVLAENTVREVGARFKS